MKIINDLKRTLFLILRERIEEAKPLADLNGRVVIITGASKGLGFTVGTELLKCGCKVVFVSRNNNDTEKSLAEYSSENYLVAKGDVTVPTDMSDIVAIVLKKFGKIDVLINNAGIYIYEPFVTSKENIDKVIDTNIKGVIYATQAVVPEMQKAKQGLIINIGSKISHNSNIQPNKVIYATTKYAIEGLSYALNRELKPDNIRVTCLMPGTINTFLSLKSGNFLSPKRVAQIIINIIQMEDVDFESILFKSRDQEL